MLRSRDSEKLEQYMMATLCPRPQSVQIPTLFLYLPQKILLAHNAPVERRRETGTVYDNYTLSMASVSRCTKCSNGKSERPTPAPPISMMSRFPKAKTRSVKGRFREVNLHHGHREHLEHLGHFENKIASLSRKKCFLIPYRDK